MTKILRSIAFCVVLLAAVFMILPFDIYRIFMLLYGITPAPIVVWTSLAGKDPNNAVVYVALIAFAIWWIRPDLARQDWAGAQAWFVAAFVFPWQALSLRLVLKGTTDATKSIFWRTLWTLLWTSSAIALARIPLAVAAGLIDGSYLRPYWFEGISSLASSGISMPIALLAPSFILSLIADAKFRSKRKKVQTS
jgi:hypothetical protein